MAFQDDVKIASDGTVPWDVEECLECLRFCQQLEETPIDDWDLQPREISLADGVDGQPAKISINLFDGLSQVSLYLVKRYSRQESFYHGIRAMQIAQFLEDHRNRLVSEGFIAPGATGEEEIPRALIQALSSLPYTQDMDGEAGHVYKAFDYDLVTTKAREFRDESNT